MRDKFPSKSKGGASCIMDCYGTQTKPVIGRIY